MRAAINMVAGAVCVAASYFFALLLRFDMSWSQVLQQYLTGCFRMPAPTIIVVIAILWTSRLHHSIWSFASFDELARPLASVPGFTMLIRMGETFAPLSDIDRQWLEGWTERGDCTVPMSFAYKNGDSIVGTEGSLAGKEATITRFNRRRSLAHVEFSVGQKAIRTIVGLAVLPGDDVPVRVGSYRQP